ncbi:hypothetical protein VitviT2T_018134 [Vitis vinifera]|uniref:Non-specific serine/threonine protein kinase n=1 Tax=Vitis vinifera TaxID=29760 RepID=A0ABY9CYZ8_VITVI|nr:hypothetical protein VitviT2T_018134 [Vitis vinifera]
MLQLEKPGLGNLVQNLTHLKELRLSQVNICSTIPHELASLSSLTSLFLRECGLHGNQSPSKCCIFLVQVFSGELPTSIGRFASLIELDISSCNFTGLVPSSLGHLPQLSYLDLSRNSFSGQISSFLGNLTQLSYLGISNNHFSGHIPSFLANLTQLTYLDLSSNDFSVRTLAWLVELHMLSKLKNPTGLLLSGNRTKMNWRCFPFLIIKFMDQFQSYTVYNLILTCCKDHFQFHHHQPYYIQSLEIN